MNGPVSSAVAFTGHRTFPRGATQEAAALARLGETIAALHASGVDTFYSGMAMGFDLAAAEAVVALRCTHAQVRLIAAVPFAGQAARYPASERARYERLLAAADEVHTLAARYKAGCYLRRNEYLIAQAAVIVAWWNGTQRGGTAHTVRAARAAGRRIVNLYDDPAPRLF